MDLGSIHENKGELTKAREYYEKAQLMEPDNTDVREKLNGLLVKPNLIGKVHWSEWRGGRREYGAIVTVRWTRPDNFTDRFRGAYAWEALRPACSWTGARGSIYKL